MKMKLKRFASIPVLSVVILVGFVHYVTVFVFIEDWFGLRSSAGLLNSLIFTFWGFLCVFSLLVCVLRDPGRVPSRYVPDVEDNQTQNGANQRNCDKCSAHKPPRAHHCRVCRRCVLRMDHHCSWINNCVGHRNYKSYLLLIFYAFIASTYSAIIIIGSALNKDWESTINRNLKAFHIGCGVLSVSLSAMLGTLLAWHVYLTSHNMTTIEHHEVKRAAWLARKSGLVYHHPYDVGFYKNISLVLGPDMLKWLWPTSVSHIKDGLSFPTIRDSS
ncbi:hypothetical protein ABFS82_06G165000 [Erythranthe guttata]|nr:PREDICTED: probable protein S-acyltransferase 15 [Erythranthe guttata]|eukprot:XP_012834953.1 PREDICTED: probable protein S-acyltransferase 15 [Erythranthe guttata]